MIPPPTIVLEILNMIQPIVSPRSGTGNVERPLESDRLIDIPTCFVSVPRTFVYIDLTDAWAKLRLVQRDKRQPPTIIKI